MILALQFILAHLATAWEVHDDRFGETPDKKRRDIFIRAAICLLTGVINSLISQGTWWAWTLVAGCLFFFWFDYMYALLVMRRRDWFAYLGTSAKMDQWKWWRGLNPWVRFAIRVIPAYVSIEIILSQLQ